MSQAKPVPAITLFISPHGLAHAYVLMSGFMDLRMLPPLLPIFLLWLFLQPMDSSGQESPHREQPKYLKKHSCVS